MGAGCDNYTCVILKLAMTLTLLIVPLWCHIEPCVCNLHFIQIWHWSQRTYAVKVCSGGGSTYKGLLRAAAADANCARLLQQVEVFFLELETFHATFQACDSSQLRPMVINILSISYSEILHILHTYYVCKIYPSCGVSWAYLNL